VNDSKKNKVQPQAKVKKHIGRITQPLTFSALEVTQADTKLYVFKAKASVLFDSLSINRRIEDKDVGYQRTLSAARVQAITRYIMQKRPIPGAVIVCLDKATFDSKKSEITIPAGTDVGWVIDGQHRLAGAEEASRQKTDIELPVVAFLDLSKEKQIQQFVTINKEAKNVPTSLYLDLLRELPASKNPTEIAKERAADLATQLRRDESSPFYERIVVATSPKSGQLSLTNFARKIAPLVIPEKGILGIYTELEQQSVIANYYKGLRQVFPKEFEAKESIFFKTLGFGALWNVFPVFFNLTLKHQQGFEVKDVVAIFKHIDTTDFSGWRQLGTGNQAEQIVGDDLKTSLLYAFREGDKTGSLRV
jgi:DGQHR domain-containing protein